MMAPPGPYLSVIVPAFQAETILRTTLEALMASDLERKTWELLVVDDASMDGTAVVAAEYADTIIRLAGRPHGPAFARNRAVEFSRGEVLVFVDADVPVHPDALGKFAQMFSANPDLGAAFGSYDLNPPAPSLVSRYRNLLHHYHHHRGAGKAGTFWAGLGAIRKTVFDEVGGYDEWHYERPQIEDIELGRRISRAGYEIVLDPTIQGTHLKHWKLGNIIETDLMHRGIPWMRLMLREGGGGNTLNVKPQEKICVTLMGLATAALAAFVATTDMRALQLFLFLITGVILLNIDLYLFMARQGGVRLAVVTLPLHLTYYFISGLSAALGHVVHLFSSEPATSATTIELTRRGLHTWPPVPKRPRSSIWDIGRSVEETP
jgi:glycosyltransferase involved in cell wall biosynthesis